MMESFSILSKHSTRERVALMQEDSRSYTYLYEERSEIQVFSESAGTMMAGEQNDIVPDTATPGVYSTQGARWGPSAGSSQSLKGRPLVSHFKGKQNSDYMKIPKVDLRGASFEEGEEEGDSQGDSPNSTSFYFPANIKREKSSFAGATPRIAKPFSLVNESSSQRFTERSQMMISAEEQNSADETDEENRFSGRGNFYSEKREYNEQEHMRCNWPKSNAVGREKFRELTHTTISSKETVSIAQGSLDLPNGWTKEKKRGTSNDLNKQNKRHAQALPLPSLMFPEVASRSKEGTVLRLSPNQVYFLAIHADGTMMIYSATKGLGRLYKTRESAAERFGIEVSDIRALERFNDQASHFYVTSADIDKIRSRGKSLVSFKEVIEGESSVFEPNCNYPEDLLEPFLLKSLWNYVSFTAPTGSSEGTSTERSW